MADVLFTTAGTLIGAIAAAPTGGLSVGAGALIGSLVGGGVDLAVNALTSQARRGQAEDSSLKVPAVDEGAGIPWVLGSNIRLPGQVIWLNVRKPKPTSKTKSDGSTIDRYFIDVAIAWTRNRCNPNPVRKIWASNEVIYLGDDVPVTVVADSHRLERREESRLIDGPEFGFHPNNQWCSPGPSDDNESWRLQKEGMALWFSATVGTETESLLAFFREGLPVTISNAADPDNDGVYDIISITDQGVSGGFRTYHFRLHRCNYVYDNAVDPCVPIDPGACVEVVDENAAGITLSQTIPGGFSPYFPEGTIETYNGDPTTDNLIADPDIEAIEGAGNVSAHRGLTYSVITNLDISKWAGTVPRFEAVIRENVFRTVKEVVEQIMIHSESFSSEDYDTSGLVNPPFIDGLFTAGPQSPANLLRQIMDLYGVVAQQQTIVDSAGARTKLVFSFREDLPIVPIPYSTSSAREQGSQGDVHALITRGSRRDIPQEFVLEYLNSDRDYQAGTSSYSITTASVRNTRKVSVPIAFTPGDADVKARELLWRRIYEHDSMEAVMPPSKFALQPGDRVQLTETSANPIYTRLEDVSVGENGLVQVRGRIDDELVAQQAPGGDDPPPLVTIPEVPQIVDVFVADIAPLVTAEASQFGVQVYVAGGNGPTFPTTAIYISIDQIEWSLVRTTTAPAIVGQTETKLEYASGHFWDTENTVQVRLRDTSELFDESEENVASGQNWALIGAEVVGFTTAVLLEPGLYELSGLLRARRDTVPGASNHFAGDPFVLLPPTGPNVVFEEIPTSLFKVDHYLRAVPAGTTIADNADSEFLFNPKAETLRPFRVHGVWALRQLTEDLCLFVTDRVRAPYRIFSALVAPQVEEGDAEDFIAEVYWDSDPAPGRVWELVRELVGCRQVDGQISFNYTRNQQVTDFHISGRITDGSFPGVYRFRIYRKSDTIGEGRVTEFCAQGYGFMPNSDCSEA